MRSVAHVAHRRRQLEPPRVHLVRRRPSRSCDVQHRRAAIAPLEPRRQRLEQPRQHERQRLEPLDRPLEIERRLEPLLGGVGTSGRTSSPRAIACQRSAGCPSRAARSAAGSAASSPSVCRPQRVNAAIAARRFAARRLCRRSSRPIVRRACRSASARAPPPRRRGATTVRPGRARASTQRRRPRARQSPRARARRAPPPRAAVPRRSSRGAPSSRSRPLTSIDDEIAAVQLVARRELLGDDRAARRRRRAPERPPAADRRMRTRDAEYRRWSLRQSTAARSRHGTRRAPRCARVRARTTRACTFSHRTAPRRTESPLRDCPTPERQRQPGRAARHRLVADQHARRLARLRPSAAAAATS